jgi:lysophospholipase L1-like esterase
MSPCTASRITSLVAAIAFAAGCEGPLRSSAEDRDSPQPADEVERVDESTAGRRSDDATNGTDALDLAPSTCNQPAPGNYAARDAIVKAEIASKRPPLLFVGDSITEGWVVARRGLDAWSATFAPMGAVDAGIGGDVTQGVLYRLGQGGELPAGYAPRLVVLMVGTNNVGIGATPACIVGGVRAIIDLFKKRSTATKILLHAILPRGGSDQGGKQARKKIATVNQRLRALADGKHVRFVDLTRSFRARDGSARPDLLPDLLHPNATGYAVWARAITGIVTQMVR